MLSKVPTDGTTVGDGAEDDEVCDDDFDVVIECEEVTNTDVDFDVAIECEEVTNTDVDFDVVIECED